MVFSFGAKADIIEDLIIAEAIVQKVPVQVALAIAKTESSMKQFKIRYEENVKDFSIGVFQVRTATAREKCGVKTIKNLIKLRVNIRCGVTYIKYQMTRYKDIRHVILAYNSGSLRYYKGEYLNQGYLLRVYKYINENKGSNK